MNSIALLIQPYYSR